MEQVQPPNSRKFSTIEGSSHPTPVYRSPTSGWAGPTRCNPPLHKAPTRQASNQNLAPLIKIFSRFGRMPTLTSPSSNKPSPNTQNCSSGTGSDDESRSGCRDVPIFIVCGECYL